MFSVRVRDAELAPVRPIVPLSKGQLEKAFEFSDIEPTLSPLAGLEAVLVLAACRIDTTTKCSPFRRDVHKDSALRV
jgi:hypothetical protein